MCVGIPGQIVDFDTAHPDLAMVDVAGVARPINLGLLKAEALRVGDWIVIHMGFALEKMTSEQATEAIEVLRTLGQGAEDDPAFALHLTDAEEPPW